MTKLSDLQNHILIYTGYMDPAKPLLSFWDIYDIIRLTNLNLEERCEKSIFHENE